MDAYPNPYVCYNRDCLFTGPMRRLLLDMQTQVDIVLSSSAFRETCTMVMNTDIRELIPCTSFWENTLVYRGNHGFDEGDYMYSLLFLWLVRRAEIFADDLRTMMRAFLITRPEAVPCEHTDPESIWNVHGNIIRCLLSICTKTQGSVENGTRNDRIACHAAIRNFADSWTIVMRSMNSAFVPEHYRPPTENVVEQIIAAICDRCVTSSFSVCRTHRSNADVQG